MKQLTSTRRSQQGAVLALVVIAMVAIIAVAGLALDTSHAYIDKTKMQNALDAAALSGAMTVMNDTSCINATDDAVATFDGNVVGTELAGLTPTIEFSETLGGTYATSCPANPRYVRAKLRDGDRFSMQTWLLRVVGKDTIQIGASAVAGPINVSPCKVGPFVVCGNPDAGCSDPNDCYGYKVNEQQPQECYIKVASPGGSEDTAPDGTACGADIGSWGSSQIGPGNFHFKQYESCETGGGKGANCMKESLGISATQQCDEADNTYVDTQTGNIVSIRDAFNTIFGEYPKNDNKLPPDEFPPDTDVREGIFYNNPNPAANYNGNNRRIMPVVIANCEADPTNECQYSDHAFKDNSGGTQCLPKLTTGCFFMTRKLPTPQDKEGGLGNSSVVYGQFVGECPNNGVKTLNPNPVFDVEKIILYKDPDSIDS
ncbi:MAG: TadE/TadG family type IV pilus assembly protein [bacterium]